jgi:hypothetical protein
MLPVPLVPPGAAPGAGVRVAPVARVRRRLIPLILACVTLAIACAPQGATLGEITTLSTATPVGAAPMFAVSPRGDQAAAWISADGGGSDGKLYVSVNDRAPSILSDTLGPIEPHGESPPKLAYGADGALYALYALYVVVKLIPGRRFPGAALRFVRSPDGGRSWDEPATVTDDTALFASHNFHALHVAADGTVFVSWLDGREGKSAAFLTRSTDGGRTWEPNRRVAPTEACPCCRTAIATGPGGVTYLAWRDVGPGNVRDIVVARSTDGGRTWGAPAKVHDDHWTYNGCPHAGPSLAVDARGRLHVAWWTGKPGAAGAWYAHTDDGTHFSEAVPLGVAAQSSPAHVQLALAGTQGVVVAWDDGTVRTARVVARVSRDGGATFAAAQPVSDAARAGGFPVLAVRGDSITIAWTATAPPPADTAAHANHPMDKTAPRPLPTVGEAQVLVRRGRLGLAG